MRDINLASSPDHVSKKIRDIETEIDNCYKTNPLIRLPFAQAVWHVLAFAESCAIVAVRPELGKRSIHQTSILLDNLSDQIEYSLQWLWTTCPKGGVVPKQFDENLIKAVQDLLQLGLQYVSFDTAFRYASRGMIELELEHTTIRPSDKLSTNSQYEAYGRFMQDKDFSPTYQYSGDFVSEIDRILSISGDKFKIQLGKRLVEKTIKILKPMFGEIYNLPENWHFRTFDLDEFRRMASYLMTHAFIHYMASQRAAEKIAKGIFTDCGLIVTTREELVWNLIRYSDVRTEKAEAFVDELTFGNMGIKSPSMKQQPLVRVNDENIIILPSWMMSNSLERNFTVLLNRIPEERKIYSELVERKESFLQEKIKTDVLLPNLRFTHATFPAAKRLPDLDLAVISDTEKIILIAELKWFISPDEPREVIERAEEIRKGIQQANTLQQAYCQTPDLFYKLLKVDYTYDFKFCVFSENFIGMDQDQAPDVPVVNVHHFIKKLNQLGSLKKAVSWLINLDYLPVEGVHFKTEKFTSKVGQWELIWEGIKPLIKEEYI